LLYSNAYKSDLFRLCFLFVKGGCYFDNKHILKCPLSEIIDPKDEEIFCNESFENGIHNGLLFTVPNNYRFKQAILDICKKVSERHLPNHVLELTGPIQVFDFFKTGNIKLQLKKKMDSEYLKQAPVYYGDKLVLYRRFIGYYEDDRFRRQEHYNALFKKKKIYYDYYYNHKKIVVLISSRSSIFRLEVRDDSVFFKNNSNNQMEFGFITNHYFKKYILDPFENVIVRLM